MGMEAAENLWPKTRGILFCLLVAVSFTYVQCAPHIEVFIVPHSHGNSQVKHDVGWIMTWEDYFTKEVKSILDTTTEALSANPGDVRCIAKFAWNERSEYGDRYWWLQADDATKDKMRKIIERGQLEFNVGGVAMNDEACTVYSEQINQMTEGHRWLQDTFGMLPGSSWHVDPFGHSSATASLWSQMGFSAHGINRVPEDVKKQMQRDKGLEFVWRGSSSLGRYTEIWTHTLSPHYYPPAEMSFDDLDRGRNMTEIADQCVDVIRKQQDWYRHDLQLITWGGDFSHQHAVVDFDNMDRLMQIVNNNPAYNMTFRYAFFSDYIRAVHSLGLEWDVFQGDFFPFFEGEHTSWTGFYTSRPSFKKYLRECDALLASAESILSLSRFNETTDYEAADLNIAPLRDAAAVATHHDAVTGTENEDTVRDYIRNLDVGVESTTKTLSATLDKQFNRTHGNGVNYAVNNALAWRRKEFVSMEIDFPDARVKDHKGKVVPSQVNPAPVFTQGKKFRLYFFVDIPPLTTNTYTIDFKNEPPKHVKITDKIEELHNGISSFHFDSEDRLREIQLRDSEKKVQVTMEYAEYLSEIGGSQSDGAYIFRPARREDSGGWSVYLASKMNRENFCQQGPGYSMDTAQVKSDSFKEGFDHVITEVGSIEVPRDPNVKDVPLTIRFNQTFTKVPVVVVSANSGTYSQVKVVIVSVDVDNVRVRLQPAQWGGNTIQVIYAVVEGGCHSSSITNEVFCAGRASSDENVDLNGLHAGQIWMTPVSSSSTGYIDIAVDDTCPSRQLRGLLRRDASVQGDISYNYLTLSVPPPIVNSLSQVMTTTVVDGPFVREVQQRHGADYLGWTFIEYKHPYNLSYTELVCQVGPIPEQGKDIILRFNTSMSNEGTFYTDDNGLEIMKRVFSPGHAEPEGANYYPMIQRVFMRDEGEGLQMNVLSDMSHGAASLNGGQLEVMILNDRTTVRTTFRLSLAPIEESARIQRLEAVLQQFPPTLIPTTTVGTLHSGLSALPENIHLLTLRRFDNADKKRLLLRLQHIYAAGEHSRFSVGVKVDLASWLGEKFEWEDMKEMTLTGTQSIDAVDKLVWLTAANSPGVDFKPVAFDGQSVFIQPMEIRTFIVNLK
ncbi:hypothetical protein PROFUN_07225 [Planoprotostelium fungivorum]|uniref:Alpha-mannosidase n=1 Tax=Planoprotostelium fungivorum TaxID=1890364 RepID=A0A2P6NM50_9EUKA|nr:hypothetical protein PROFUN_07225 [Planoprotostelium fungivorum]